MLLRASTPIFTVSAAVLAIAVAVSLLLQSPYLPGLASPLHRMAVQLARSRLAIACGKVVPPRLREHIYAPGIPNIVTTSSAVFSSSSISSTRLSRPSPLASASASSRQFSSTAAMSGSKAFMEAVKARRTYYQINNQPPVSDEKIEELLRDTVLNVPSSFNSQSTRIVTLLKKEHETFWDMVLEVLEPLTPKENFPTTKKKIQGFKAGYGTILFFEDPNRIHDLQNRFPIYAERFPQWSEHTSAMHQFVLWTTLELEGFGANLQHYNPIIDQKAQAHWNIPQEWSLKAQLVFGGRAAEPGPKNFDPIEERLFIHGK